MTKLYKWKPMDLSFQRIRVQCNKAKHASKKPAESSQCRGNQEAESTLEMAELFWTLKAHFQGYSSLNKATPPYPSKTVPRTVDQAFKHMYKYLGAISIQTTIVNNSL